MWSIFTSLIAIHTLVVLNNAHAFTNIGQRGFMNTPRFSSKIHQPRRSIVSPHLDSNGRRSHSLNHHVVLFSSKTSNSNNNTKQKKLSRPERKALERKKKGKRNKSGKGQRKYKLHSTKVSVLSKSKSTAEDVIVAIKRAQNKHDVHDIRNIAKFLLNEVDDSFAYGFRGSLLARLAVAALHMSEHDSARRAIEVRKIEHKSSMLPMESAAIIRGLLRVHNVTDAISVLEDELPIPSEVRSVAR